MIRKTFLSSDIQIPFNLPDNKVTKPLSLYVICTTSATSSTDIFQQGYWISIAKCVGEWYVEIPKKGFIRY